MWMMTPWTLFSNKDDNIIHFKLDNNYKDEDYSEQQEEMKTKKFRHT